MSPRVSVVVPTCNRTDLLARCLAALLAQDYDAAEYEIIVVDDANSETARGLVGHVVESARFKAETEDFAFTGATLGLARAWAPVENVIVRDQGDRTTSLPQEVAAEPAAPLVAVPAVHYIPITGKHGPAVARNAGWRTARGEIIAFTDDDCIPAPGWLRAGMAAFSSDVEVIGVSGQIVMPLPLQPTDYELNASALQRSEFVTANCFYRRDALAAVGGFDEAFTAAWREDTDLFFALLRFVGAGVATSRFVAAPTAIVFHPIRPAPWAVSLKQQRKSKFNALLYKKHPTLYRERIQAGPPWHYYAMVGLLLAALVGWLTWLPWMASGAIGIWAVLTAHFCRDRLRATARTPLHVTEMLVTSILIPPLAVFWRIAGAVTYRVLFL